MKFVSTENRNWFHPANHVAWTTTHGARVITNGLQSKPLRCAGYDKVLTKRNSILTRDNWSNKVAQHRNNLRKHLYNSVAGKGPWFIKRFGAREIVLKPLRVLLAPFIIPRLPQKTFQFQGRSLTCFYHRYNMTWAGERCIEIPIAKSYLDQYSDKRVLEVGNVLSHYLPFCHDILDKFEKGPGIINEDIIGFTPSKQYDLILSISTFEHIGYDDEAEESSRQKIQRALAACRTKLLAPGGKLVITVPVGYNPELDQMMESGELGASSEFYMRRVQKLDWVASVKAEALRCRFRTPFPYANAILVAEFLRT